MPAVVLVLLWACFAVPTFRCIGGAVPLPGPDRTPYALPVPDSTKPFRPDDTIRGVSGPGPIRFDTVQGFRPFSDWSYFGDPDIPDYTFPLVRCEGCETVADSLNLNFLREMLYIDSLGANESIFAEVRGTADNPHSGLTYCRFRVIEPISTIIAIEFEGEWCGAYCERFEQYHLFDARNGASVHLKDLFAGEDLIWIAEQSRTKVVKEIEEYVEELWTWLDDPENGSERLAEFDPVEDREYVEAVAELYEECLESRWGDSDVDDVRDDPASTDYIDVSVLGDSLVMVRGRCSPHVSRALDELWTFRQTWPLRELRSRLTPYGRELLRL